MNPFFNNMTCPKILSSGSSWSYINTIENFLIDNTPTDESEKFIFYQIHSCYNNYKNLYQQSYCDCRVYDIIAKSAHDLFQILVNKNHTYFKWFYSK